MRAYHSIRFYFHPIEFLQYEVGPASLRCWAGGPAGSHSYSMQTRPTMSVGYQYRDQDGYQDLDDLQAHQITRFDI